MEAKRLRNCSMFPLSVTDDYLSIFVKIRRLRSFWQRFLNDACQQYTTKATLTLACSTIASKSRLTCALVWTHCINTIAVSGTVMFICCTFVNIYIWFNKTNKSQILVSKLDFIWSNCLTVPLFIRLSFHLSSVCVPFFLSVHLFTWSFFLMFLLSTCSSFSSIYLSIYSSICVTMVTVLLFLCPSVNLSICPSSILPIC